MPTQIPRNGRPELDGVAHRLLQAGAAQRRHAGAEGPDAGQHDGDGIGDQPAIGGQAGVGAEPLERLLRRVQVADAVVADRDEGTG